MPLIGEAGAEDICESCRRHPPAWDRGAAAVLYQGAGRRVVLALKHGDRLDMVRPLAGWMAAAGRELLADADVIAPVPLHWRRLVMRRYNQSAELARRLARLSGRPAAVDLLVRRRADDAAGGHGPRRAGGQPGRGLRGRAAACGGGGRPDACSWWTTC